jgi:SPP1 family predicted phage head-tail adaptor
MRAGKLDKTIVVQRVATTVDEYGTPAEDWTTVATVRAQRLKLTAEEFLRAYGNASETVAIFRIRHLDGLTLGDRITCEGETFNLKAIEPLGRRKGLELRCVAAGD